MCRPYFAAVLSVLVATMANGQTADKAADQPEVTADQVRRSGLRSKAVEAAELQYYYQLGERAYPAYEVVLSDPKSEPQLVFQILVMIATQTKYDRSRFRPLVRKRLTDPVDFVRYWAVPTVGAIGTTEDLPALAAFLSSDDKRVVRMAATAVGTLGGETALSALEVWLLSAREREDPGLREHVTECRDDLKLKLEAKKKPALAPKP